MGRTRWGLSDSEWVDARECMTRLLADIAANRSTITYGDIAREVFGGRISARSSGLYEMLGEVCTEQDAKRGTMLASLVVRKDTGIPGEGYFVHAAGLGRDVSDREAFWQGEVEKIWRVWSTKERECE